MAQNRPNKPSVTLPDNFGGVKKEFSSTRISNGYESSTPEIVEGGNLNYMLDGLFQNTKYMRTVLDYVRDTPVGKMFWVNSSGKMDYIQPAIIATDTEFSTGTATDKTPNVKQVVDNLATKQATITGAATTITRNNLTASRALVSDSSGKVAVSSVTGTEIGYLSGVTSAIQTQLNAKAPLASPALTGTPTTPTAGTGVNNTQIASTAYVNNKFKVVSTLPASPDSNVFYYVTGA